VIGAFKSLTTNAYIDGVRHAGWPRFDQHVWQRSYHDRIIRDPEHLERARRYTGLNPWRLCQAARIADATFDCLGNLALLERALTPVLLSRRATAAERQRERTRVQTLAGDPGSAVVSGFHSPGEQECLDVLLAGRAGIVYLPVCATAALALADAWLPALEANRMVVASPFASPTMDRATALARNDWVRRLAAGAHLN
jgi:hypothetical protein